jgi:UDP-2,4-diacetamido-2,4,6-trideoxy-beta-L-altropyranose hydrolase
MGTGHVMRCLALAQAWQDAGGRATFAMAESTPALRERLRAENCEVLLLKAEPGSVADAGETASAAKGCGAGWVVVDGYHFGADYQRALGDAGCKVLFIDDNGHAGSYSADLVLNQNVYAKEDFYRRREARARLLLGTKYALLRREFGAWKDWPREIPARARQVLVTMGGSDPDNITARVLRSVLCQPDAVATVVLGGSNPHLAELRDAAHGFAGRVRLLENVQDMPALIAGADVAVSGAGTTTLEMCYLGLPSLLAVLAENQERVAEELSARGVAVNLGEGTHLDLAHLEKRLAEVMASAEMRTAMSVCGRQLVDGLGSQRVVRAIRPPALRIRRAEDADCRTLWELANDPVVRASAFSEASIPWERHIEWFRDRIQGKRCHILVGEAGGDLVGQVRVDECADREGEVDVSVARNFRGEGLGSRLIDLAVREIFASTGLLRIHAFVRPENQASQRAFTKAGFERAGEQEVKGHRALHYMRSRANQP